MEPSLKSVKTYLVVWLSGVFAGLILVERWRRVGARGVPAAESAEDATETAAASTPSSTPPEKPKVSALIIAGAKADAQRARRLLDQMMPWESTSDPSVAELRRWSRATPSTSTSVTE